MQLVSLVTILFLSSALAAPRGLSLDDACSDVQNSSAELNKLARDVSLEAHSVAKDARHLFSFPEWIEAVDECDPGSLQKQPGRCVTKISALLKSYRAMLEMAAGFQSCSDLSQRVMPALRRLHSDLDRCVGSRDGMKLQEPHMNKETKPTMLTGDWPKAFFCRYTLDRLFSFSVLAARVFAVGDPSNHTPTAPAVKCV